MNLICITFICFTFDQILDQIEQYGIQIYPLPDCDSDEDEDYKVQCKQLKVKQFEKIPVLFSRFKPGPA